MKLKNSLKRIVSFILAFIMISGTVCIFAFADDASTEEIRAQVADKIVAAAREKIGYYDSNINEFTTWYYGYETEASWCTIFVSWCADQGGAIGSAVPKRSTCDSMRNWFKRKGEYYPADSGYVPQKGDIVFLNTAVDGTDAVHHVEIVTESGFIVKKKVVNVKCIGGNTSDLNYNGSEYVTEKVRPVDGSRATVVGYAHPSYEKSLTPAGDFHNTLDDTSTEIFKFLYSKLISIIIKLEALFMTATIV